MSSITGYKQDTAGSYILKDPEAKLVYSMNWSEWLAVGQTVVSVDYTHNSRANDTAPLVIVTDGVQSNTITYAEIRGGAVGKIYTVTADITTDDGATDRRSFRIKVENRSA
jgi:hypothetical protein